MRRHSDSVAFATPIVLPKYVFWLTLFALSACSGGGRSTPAPVATADAYVYPSTQTLTVAAPGVLTNDIGASLTAVLVSAPAHAASFALNPNGSFTYTSNDGTSNDTFSYRATNAGGSSNVTTVSLTRNQPPTSVNACVPTPAGTSLNGTLTATDESGSQPDIYGPVPNDPNPVGPYKGQVQINQNGTFTYTPNKSSLVGMDKFRFQVTDRFGLTSTGIVTVLINSEVRIMPLGDSITQGVYRGAAFPGECDPDGDCPVRSNRIGYRMMLWTDLQNPSYTVNFVGTLHDGSAAGLVDDTHEGHPGDCVGPVNSGCQGADEYDSSITRNLSDNITGWLDLDQPDIILLHAGTNGLDSNTVNPTTTNANAVDTLLQKISTWAQSNYPVTVFLARIIPSVDGTLDVQDYNNLVAQIPAGNHPNVRVIMVDQQSQIALSGSPNFADPTYMTQGNNNLHPNQTGYDRMAGKWYIDMVNSGQLPTCP